MNLHSLRPLFAATLVGLLASCGGQVEQKTSSRAAAPRSTTAALPATGPSAPTAAAEDAGSGEALAGTTTTTGTTPVIEADD